MTEVLIRFETAHVFVAFVPKQVTVKALIAAVKKSGYEAREDKEAKWPEEDT